MSQSRRKFDFKKIAILLGAFFILSATGSQYVFSQPTNYCNTCDVAQGYMYSYAWCYTWAYGYLTRVRLYDGNTNETSFDRVSGFDASYFFTNVWGRVVLGNLHKLDIQVYGYYGWYSYWGFRAWIDYNQDGDFFDAGERLNPSNYYVYGYAYSLPLQTVPFTVPVTATPGPTRLRVIGSYYMYDYGPCFNGYAYDYPPYYFYNYGYYGECEDYVVEIGGGVKDTYPDDGDVLYANELYDNSQRMKNGVLTDFKKPRAYFYSSPKAGSLMTFRIDGPKPSTNTVYRGLAPWPSTDKEIPIGNAGEEYVIQHAEGDFAYPKSPYSTGNFMGNRGGTYRIYAYILESPTELIQTFTVSWDNDLAVSEIVSPKANVAPSFMKYLRGTTISVKGKFQNVGINPISEFEGWAYILGPLPSLDTVYRSYVHWDTTGGALLLRRPGSLEMSFSTFRTNVTGVYRLFMHCNLLSDVDQDDFNDHIPRQGDPYYTFEVQHEIELQANKIIAPPQGAVLLGNRPVIPLGEFKNNGVGDASDVPVKLIVYKLPDLVNPVYQSNKIIQDVPSGKYNTASEYFDVMKLRETGTYKACLIISASEDVVRENDTTCITFTVDGGLIGTYSIGDIRNAEDPSKWFPTIDSAMNALYYKGLAGSVIFKLTESSYTVSGPKPTDPAWDFTSYIINLGYDAEKQQYNTITWQPSNLKAIQRGSVTINLKAGNGVGVLFGQNMYPTNKYAICNEFSNRGDFVRQYANSPGYIIFDGGPQKALKFVLYSSSSAHGAAFYLGRGSQNIQVKNCLIENATPNIACNVWLPMTSYNPQFGFQFQPDTLQQGSVVTSYSAGIVNRSIVYRNDLLGSALKLDTLPNINNVFKNNEIDGFGYGILSLGIGQLWLDMEGEYGKYYNKNNEYSGNIIGNVCRAGIYLGYEENSLVRNNRIYNVMPSSGEAAGIILGGDGTTDYKGYHTINVTVDGNEISNIVSNSIAYGIKVEQDRNSFQHPRYGVVYFPDINENTKVINNAVWGMKVTNANANRAGIHLFTQRTTANVDAVTKLITPLVPEYFTQGDKVVNNTVIMSDDGISTNGAIVGIGIQNSKGTIVKNNALALEDNNVTANSPVYSCIFYKGMLPMDADYKSDWNAFWVSPITTGAVYRFIETDENSNILELGSRMEFQNLSQWQMWTKSDINSIEGNFTVDMVKLGTEPKQRLRVRTNPTPIGSILNNRGENLSFVTTDIDGNQRGAAGQVYDIGHCEFDGRLYLTDVEVTTIPTPAAYKSVTGDFNDAEYCMLTSPVEVIARLRNNGTLNQSAIPVHIKIFMETPMGTFNMDSPFLDVTVNATIAPNNSAYVPFHLADGTPEDFVPLTYGDLRRINPEYANTMPAKFKTMENNVTPRYKILVYVESDDYNANNEFSKIVRFYVMRSKLTMLVSTENSWRDITPASDVDHIAGRLNYDSLIAGLFALGWFTDILAEEPREDIDIFDRTSWEVRSIDYKMYRTMFWADGNDKMLTRLERMDIKNFLSNGNTVDKKALVLGSQEMVRELEGKDQAFLQTVLRAENVYPGNPQGSSVSNNGNKVIGVNVGRNLVQTINKTMFTNDPEPYCGLMSVYEEGEGLARVGYKYEKHDAAPNNDVMGVATTTLTRNVILLGVDWRHFSSNEMILRAVVDYILNNGGRIIPVELVDFKAVPVGNRIDITWATASEPYTDRFEVERAEKTNSGNTNFVKIATEKAAGTSSVLRNYGPIADKNVALGKTYIYRLKMIDVNGEFEYSKEVEVQLTGQSGIWLGDATPNPAGNQARFEFGLPEASNIEITLYDVNGKQVLTIKKGFVQAGTSEVKVDLTSLSSGSYTYVLKVGDLMFSRQLQVVR